MAACGAPRGAVPLSDGEHAVNRHSGPLGAGRHEVGVGPEGEPGVGVTEVLGQLIATPFASSVEA